jgi:methionine sulfoxide reductase heme-binding subunit
MPRSARRLLEGWRLTCSLSFSVAAIALAVLWWNRFGVEGMRSAIRSTARTSLVFFCLAFGASALFRRWPADWSAWVRRNRRHLGLSFAASHALHALAIAGFALLDPVQFRLAVTPASFVFGGVAYAFVLALTATSFDRSAAWLGPRAWKILHSVGAHYVWFIFLVSVVKRALAVPAYWLPAALLLGVMALRVAPSPDTRKIDVVPKGELP